MSSNNQSHKYDVIVIGGGSAGYAAALRLTALEKTVLLFEKDQLGGTCLHRGCIPTKALLHVAELADKAQEAETFGIQADLSSFDAKKMLSYKDKIVSGKFEGLKSLLKAAGISVKTAAAKILDPHTVEADGERYSAEHIVIATGAKPRVLPDFPLSSRIITSDEALKLDWVPAEVAIIGGGVIGVEFASLWSSLGAKVTIFELSDRLVPAEEPSISKALERAFKKRGISVVTQAEVKSATQDGEKCIIKFKEDQEETFDLVLLALGRESVIDSLGLEELGIEMVNGQISLNDLLQSSIPNIWAVGDIAGGPQLAHKAYQHGIQVAETIAGLAPTPVESHLVPRICYSSPEIASVGLSEEEAKKRYGADSVITGEYNLAGNAKSSILGTSGFVKAIRLVDGPIVGVHAIGDRVSELIAEAQLVVAWDAHPEDIAPFIHPHPTQSEALGEVFLLLAKKPLHTRL